MVDTFEILDTVFLHKDTVVSFFNPMFKLGDLTTFSNEIFRDFGLSELSSKLYNSGKGQLPVGRNTNEWIESGKECELLVPGAKGWQKGRLRIKVVLEFCSDEPEIEETLEDILTQTNSKEQSLDDIRQILNKYN